MRHHISGVFTVIIAIISVPMFCQITPIANMNQARSGHTATQMITAEVVAIGGLADGNFLNSVEYWDQGNDVWIELDDLEIPRMSHQATVVDGNRIVVTGGWNGGKTSLGSCEIYNFDIGAWEVGPDMNDLRSLHRATKLDNSQIFISGGTDNLSDLNSCEIFNPLSLMFSPAASMEFGRSSHTATRLSDGRVLVTGGYNPDHGFQMSSCEIYEPSMDTWTTVAPMNAPRDNHAAVMLNADQVLVSGGRWFNAEENRFEGRSDYEIYDIPTDSWMGPYELGAAYSFHDMAVMWSSEANVFIPGGTDHSGDGVDLTYSQLSYFEEAGMPFSSPGDYPVTEKFRYAMAPLNDGLALVCGGEDDNTAYIFGIATHVEETHTSDFLLYPNPGCGTLRCNACNGEFRCLDLSGKIVAKGSIDSGQIDLPELDPGTYILSTETGAHRIVIE